MNARRAPAMLRPRRPIRRYLKMARLSEATKSGICVNSSPGKTRFSRAHDIWNSCCGTSHTQTYRPNSQSICPRKRGSTSPRRSCPLVVLNISPSWASIFSPAKAYALKLVHALGDIFPSNTVLEIGPGRGVPPSLLANAHPSAVNSTALLGAARLRLACFPV